MKMLYSLTLFILYMSACVNDKSEIYAGDIRLYKQTPAWELAQAVEKEDTNRIKNLCRKDTSLIHYQEPKFGQSLLEWAVYTNRYQAAKALAEAGADPNLQSYNGTSAFIHAAEKHETTAYLKLLLKYGGDVNAVASGNQSLKTPLIAAAYTSLENVKLLVDAGANVNYVDDQYRSALLAACLFNRIEIVHYLIMEKGADFKRPVGYTINGDSTYIVDHFRYMTFPLDSKEYRIKMEVVEYIKKEGVDYNATPIPSHFYKNYSKEYLDKY